MPTLEKISPELQEIYKKTKLLSNDKREELKRLLETDMLQPSKKKMIPKKDSLFSQKKNQIVQNKIKKTQEYETKEEAEKTANLKKIVQLESIINNLYDTDKEFKGYLDYILNENNRYSDGGKDYLTLYSSDTVGEYRNDETTAMYTYILFYSPKQKSLVFGKKRGSDIKFDTWYEKFEKKYLKVVEENKEIGNRSDHTNLLNVKKIIDFMVTLSDEKKVIDYILKKYPPEVEEK